MRRVLHGGLQPQVAATADGTIHLVYFLGEPRRGDLFYSRSRDGGATFAQAVRVNSIPGSAIATGTIRGAQIAVGSSSRVHVAWNGVERPAWDEPTGACGCCGMGFSVDCRGNVYALYRSAREMVHRAALADGSFTVFY